MKNPLLRTTRSDFRFCTDRVVRGGGWFYDARRVRVSYRSLNDLTDANDDLGFRLFRSME